MIPESLLPMRMEDEDWWAGERFRCAACTRHVRVAVAVATLDLGEEVLLCPGCIAKAKANLEEMAS